MTNPYRAMCAELADALAEWRLGGGPPEDTADADLIDRARALLAQPVAQPPADGEVAELVETLKGIAYWRRHGTIGGLAPAPFDIRQADRLDRAAELLQRLASDNAGLEAAAESAYLDNLSLLDSQND